MRSSPLRKWSPSRLPQKNYALNWLLLVLSTLLIVACDSTTQGGIALTPTPAQTTTPDFSSLPSAGNLAARIVLPGTALNYEIAASDTSIWVHDADDGTVLRIDPHTDQIVATIHIISQGTGDIAVGDSGVWVVSSNDGTVRQIDPQTNRVVATVHLTSPLNSLVVSPGAVWVTSKSQNTLWRIDPVAHKVVATLDTLRSPETPSFGAGSLWICNFDDLAHGVIRIDPQTNQIIDRIDIGSSQGAVCGGLAALDNTVWVLVYQQASQTGNWMERIDPATNKVIGHFPLPDGLSHGPKADGQGAWVWDRDGNIYHVNARTNRVVSQLTIPGTTDIAPGNGAIWVCSANSEDVEYIAPVI